MPIGRNDGCDGTPEGAGFFWLCVGVLVVLFVWAAVS
jgi:hypothetical protein